MSKIEENDESKNLMLLNGFKKVNLLVETKDLIY